MSVIYSSAIKFSKFQLQKNYAFYLLHDAASFHKFKLIHILQQFSKTNNDCFCILTVWVYEPTPCVCQLYTPGAQVLQPEHTVLCHSQKQVRYKEKQIVKKIDLCECFISW